MNISQSSSPRDGRVRVGVIGAGGIAPVHLDAWHALDADIVIYSLHGAVAAAERYGARVVDTVEALLAAVDVVDIITTTSTHHDFARQALRAGKHVICEKPLGVTSGQARQMADAAAAMNRILFPAHVVRYFPEYAAAKRLIDDGRLGQPAVVRLSRAGQAPDRESWFFDERLGGGLIRDQMIHDLDQARWLAGEVTQVFAVQNPRTVDGRVPAPVSAHVVLTHVSGAISHIDGQWGPPGTTFRTQLHVAGSAGSIEYQSPDDGATSIDIPTDDADSHYLPPITHAVSPYLREIEDFVSAIERGVTPRVTPWDGVVALGLVEAAYHSIATGRAVAFDVTAPDFGLSEGLPS